MKKNVPLPATSQASAAGRARARPESRHPVPAAVSGNAPPSVAATAPPAFRAPGRGETASGANPSGAGRP